MLRRARLRWRHSLRVGDGNSPALPLARPLASFQALGARIPPGDVPPGDVFASPARPWTILACPQVPIRLRNRPDFIGALARIRPPHPHCRSRALYPAEVRGPGVLLTKSAFQCHLSFPRPPAPHAVISRQAAPEAKRIRPPRPRAAILARENIPDRASGWPRARA